MQYDFGAGPVIDGVAVLLFCAWLSREPLPGHHPDLRQVAAVGDRALDRTCLMLPAASATVGVTDNEKTVTDRHIARDRRAGTAAAVDVSRYYGITHCHLCAVRSRVQGRFGVDASRWPRPTWSRPSTTCFDELPLLRRARGGVRKCGGRTQRPAPLGDPAAARSRRSPRNGRICMPIPDAPFTRGLRRVAHCRAGRRPSVSTGRATRCPTGSATQRCGCEPPP